MGNIEPERKHIGVAELKPVPGSPVELINASISRMGKNSA
jgi:hypothetical protein